VDGTLCEVKHPHTPEKLNTLKHRVEEAARQADYVLILLESDIDINQMRRACKGRFIDYHSLESVEFLFETTSTSFKRNDFLYGEKESLH
jgi:hypothetical protein